jgi:Osmosensitive K+ channel histidine kinase
MPLDNDDLRPDPDALLAETRPPRGHLKVFFGACAGVGKTYAMLQEARRLRAEGLDVLIGVVETHGRSETAALLDGLTQLPLKQVHYRKHTFHEFDIDGALSRAPALILMDELAHSNMPGSRHPKRWQDVEELLAAGINVLTTLNVQHLESLNDIVGSITGIRVRETVPDRLYEEADEVVLVDLPPDDLRRRLNEGKVYLPQQAERAIEHFFRKENLIALRELALRCTADRVDDQMQAFRHSGEPVWHTRDAILVCIGPGGGNEKLVRVAARLAGRLGCIWHAVYVETPRLHRRPEQERRSILATLHLAQELGAETSTLPAQDEAEAVLHYAREHNLGKILIGRHTKKIWHHWWKGSFAHRLGTQGPELDLLIVSLTESDTIPIPLLPADIRHKDEKWQRQFSGVGFALLSCVVITLISSLLINFLAPLNIVMLYLLGVVFVALLYGRVSSSVSAIINVASFDFFFVTPRFSFAVSDVQYLLTFGVMLLIGLLIGQLTAWARYQARVAQYREERARNLFEMAKALSSVLTAEDVARIAEHFLKRSFRATSALLLPDEQQHLHIMGRRQLQVDQAIAQWCFDRNEHAGMGTDTLPAATQRYVPLITPLQTLGILVLEPANLRMLMIPEQQRLLDTYALLIAVALERLRLAHVAEEAKLHSETERLRNALLAALSHDLRTPLTVLFAQAEMLMQSLTIDKSPHTQQANAIRAQVLGTTRLVNNLLDMARLESEGVHLRKEWQSLQEMVGSALTSLNIPLTGHPLNIQIPPDLPLLFCDGVLIERVLVNLLENGCKYAGDGVTIGIDVEVLEIEVLITVWNLGPELPIGQEKLIFEKFARGEKESTTPGVGLGLAICRAIIETHGGRIWAENRSGGGVNFYFTLPLQPLPELEPELISES